jgi:hypothetical protein
MQLFEWLQQHPEVLAWSGGLSVAAFVGTLAAVPLVIVSFPRDYLSSQVPPRSAHWPTSWRWTYRILKNGIGWVLMLAGLAMLVLPGQGLLTLLVGVVLSDIPGKRRVIRGMMGRERILIRLNRLRAKFKRPPLIPP